MSVQSKSSSIFHKYNNRGLEFKHKSLVDYFWTYFFSSELYFNLSVRISFSQIAKKFSKTKSARAGRY